MKKNFTKLFLTGLFLCGVSLSMNAQYTGNSSWAGIPDFDPIVEENFQDWGNYKDADGFGQMPASLAGCATSSRGQITPVVSGQFEVSRTSTAGTPFVFYLDFCAIQTECDTQSGAMNTAGETGNDNQGPSTPNVSIGAIAIYDNYQTIRDAAAGYLGNGMGSITTCKIPFLERVRWTHSSYGRGRGFKLEIGRETVVDGKTVVEWSRIRQFAQHEGTNTYNFPAEDYVIPGDWAGGAKDYWYLSNAGWVFDEIINEADVYLRWTTSYESNNQIARVHDIRLYGESPTEIVNPYTLGGVNIPAVAADKAGIAVRGNRIVLAETSDVYVYDLLGRQLNVLKGIDEATLDMVKGTYIIKAISNTGKTSSKKIIL